MRLEFLKDEANKLNTMEKENQYNPSTVFHPGETLYEKLEEIKMDAKEFAFKVGVSEETIINVMNCESSITTELAVAFERITKIPAHFWINSQRNYDIWYKG